MIVQDPAWERTFPDVGGVSVPYADPGNGRVVPADLTRAEAARLRERHEDRWAQPRPVLPGARARAGRRARARPGRGAQRLPPLGRRAGARERAGGVKRRLLLAAVVALAAAAPAAATLPQLPSGSSVGDGVPLKAYASLTPPVHLFGDPVTASIAVVADTRWVDPERLRVTASFRPYQPIHTPTMLRLHTGRFEQITWTWKLRCLTRRACRGCRRATTRTCSTSSSRTSTTSPKNGAEVATGSRRAGRRSRRSRRSARARWRRSHAASRAAVARPLHAGRGSDLSRLGPGCCSRSRSRSPALLGCAALLARRTLGADDAAATRVRAGALGVGDARSSGRSCCSRGRASTTTRRCERKTLERVADELGDRG